MIGWKMCLKNSTLRTDKDSARLFLTRAEAIAIGSARLVTLINLLWYYDVSALMIPPIYSLLWWLKLMTLVGKLVCSKVKQQRLTFNSSFSGQEWHRPSNLFLSNAKYARNPEQLPIWHSVNYYPYYFTLPAWLMCSWTFLVHFQQLRTSLTTFFR